MGVPIAVPEDQLKAQVGDILRDAGSLTDLSVAWRTEVHPDDIDGRADLGATVNGLLTGHVELKLPGLGERPEHFTRHNRSQREQFRALPNLICADGGEWSLYRSGELKPGARIAADVSQGGARAVDPGPLDTIRELLRDFLYWDPIVPGTAEGLAGFLAPLARVLRDDVRAALAGEASPLRALVSERTGLLFPEEDDAQFADAHAQTVAHALLLARFEGAESLRPAIAVDALQREHGLFAEGLQLLEAPAVREELRMPIELLERAILAEDSAKLGQSADPWWYFYEQFLSAYDPKLRKDRGVYYTPVEVVRAQVTLAGELLRTRFGKPLVFADDDVVVLDPAVGTGTHPLAVLDHASGAVLQRVGPGAVAGKLRDLAERLYAFEVLVGPYSVAQLRLSRSLRNAGVTDKTPRVYLTDTMESPNHPPQFMASLLQAQLKEERKRAQDVKKDVRVFVCPGNPPYDREDRDPNEATGKRKGGWVRHGDEEQEGSDNRINLHARAAAARRAGREALGPELLADPEYRLNPLTTVQIPDGIDDATVRSTLLNDYGIEIGGGLGEFRVKAWCIGLMGDSARDRNVLALLSALEQMPNDSGYGVANGLSLSASRRPRATFSVWCPFFPVCRKC